MGGLRKLARATIGRRDGYEVLTVPPQLEKAFVR